MNNNNIKIFDTPGALSEAAAKFIVGIAKEAIAVRGRFSVSLSGGNTPNQLYSLLAQPEFTQQIDWKNTFVFWGDERCVPQSDERNNSHMARVTLLDKVNVPAENIFPVPVELAPAEAAQKYEKQIQDLFKNETPRFDLTLLGLGDNAHTASLFPNTPVLDEKIALVKEVYVEEVKMVRITMTAPLINQSHNIIFLVTGENKAATVKTILQAPYEPHKYPAQLIKPVDGNLYWFLDTKAASQISGE